MVHIVLSRHDGYEKFYIKSKIGAPNWTNQYKLHKDQKIYLVPFAFIKLKLVFSDLRSNGRWWQGMTRTCK